MSNQPRIQDYSIDTFLKTHPELKSHLPIIEKKIGEYFDPSSQVHYEIYRDPESGDEQLVIEIVSTESPDVSLAKLRRFDNDWWIAYSEEFNDLIVINVGF